MVAPESRASEKRLSPNLFPDGSNCQQRGHASRLHDAVCAYGHAGIA
jgi:hypothetical protein